MKIRNLFQIFLAVMMMAMFTSATEALAQGTGSSFSITVTADPAEGGTVTGGSSGSYADGTQLEFKEIPNEGYRFKNWTIDGIPGGLEDTYPFIVDGNFSTVVAYFERVYTLSGSNVFFFPEGSYDPITVAAEGETVVVSANPELTPNGKYLSGYSATTGVTLTQLENSDASFTMPAMDVTVDPVYTDQMEYTIDLTTSTSAAVPDMVFFMLQRLGSDSQYLDLNGDGTNDLELTVNQDFTTFYVTKLEGGYSKDTHVALVTYPIDNSQYNSVFFKLGNEAAVEAKDIATLTITLSGTEFTYTGQPIEPTVTVKDGNTPVAVTLDYSNNTNAAEATATNAPTVTVTANAAGYTGSVTKTFTIAPKEVKVSGLSAEEKNYDPHNDVATINCRGAVFNGLIEGDELTISDVTGTYIIGENVDATLDVTLDVTLDYTNATLGGKSAANYKLATEGNQATTTITIHKVLQTFTITFDPNGGTGEMDPMSAQKGETVRLKDNIFYRQGYSFKNWNTKADGSGDEYEDKQSIKIDEDLTLYAQWKEKNIIETNIETKKNLDGSTTTTVTSKETDSSGKLVKESNTSTTQYPDGSKKILESLTPETDNAGRSINIGDGDDRGWLRWKDARYAKGVELLIPQGSETNVLVNTTTEKNAQGEVTATSASLTVKQNGSVDDGPTKIAINTGGGDNGGGSENPKNPDAPTSGKCGGYMTWVVSANAGSSVYDVLTISGSGQMDDMIEVSPWDAYHNQIKTVILESVISEEDNMEGVTSIGVMAFNGCSSLKSVTIPQSVTSIGQLAFYGCSSLTSVTIPAGVTSIGESAFSGCSSLKSVTIPAGVTSIGEYAFNGCSAMTSLTFAEGSQLQTIGKYAFDGLTSLTSDIILPAGVTSMGKGAFARVSENTTVGISITAAAGSRLTAIDTYAFSGANASIDLSNCSKLKAIGSDLVFSQVTGDVTLPSSVTSICQYAFENQYSTHYPGKHVYVTVPDGKKLKVMIAGVTDPVEITPTNGKADIIGCLFDDSSKRIASRALTLEIVEASAGGDNSGGSASGQGQEPSTREKNDRAATTMIVNYEKEKTGSAGGNISVVSSREEVHSTAATAGSLEGEGGAGADPDLVKGDHNTGGTTAGSRAATAEEENDEIEIVSGREYEILHDGYVVLNFYTAGGSITVNSIIIRSPGDANNDGYVNAADIVEMINAKNGKASERFNLTNADIDRDGDITQDDIDAVVKLIMEPKDKGDE